MGKKLKKGEKGAVTNYITRTQAIKKLQISLAAFRRLCILKGIYPREPKNKKKVGKGSTKPQTYYYRKDIQFLLHEPVLQKLREQKVFARRLTRAISKKEYALAKNLEEMKPEYTLDHIIKERYPSFIDALRDVDDALSMVFLFATLPTDDKIANEHVRTCQRLSAEFQHYVLTSRSLRKTFLSIKGIYYQAEIMGQEITWIVPYQFSQNVPTNVDFRVMATFLELYETLLGFVNFKLYSDANLVYPPKVDQQRDEGAAGLGAYVIESTQGQDLLSDLARKEGVSVAGTKADKKKVKQSEKRLKSLGEKISAIASAENDDNEEDLDDAATAAPSDDTETDLPQSLAPATTDEESVPTLQTFAQASTTLTQFQNLFRGCVFYLSREVPRYSLEFVIRAFGGEVGWPSTSGAFSPFSEDDPRITHQIVDRPPVSVDAQAPNAKGVQGEVKRYDKREYLQPQWVYDCVNARRLVKSEGYRQGETLPPHLSPFVVAREGEYVPEVVGMEVDEVEENDAEGEEDEVEIAVADEEEEEEEEEEKDEEEEEASIDSSDEEALHQAELQAEAAGLTFSEFQQQKKKQQKSNSKKAPVAKESAAEKQAREERELAKMMMNKKDKHLYNKIQFGKKRKEEAADKLRQKKAALKQSSGGVKKGRRGA
ncbi:mRNA-binding ribosome synthesis protein nop7 [Rhizophlyctis rosea]|uniref:Pescadillo homolog n=1 Tax=Rhizophlyctis rosea TaxID=64517 RepID=A0AAD5WXP6_9FUNG|nr:mRNA-binding ribosome synthesis protein nop7 [Rhizophlyctis rosea]